MPRTPAEPPRKKKKGPKAPNPLSVKKKKTKQDDTGSKLDKVKEKTRKTTKVYTGLDGERIGDKRKRIDEEEAVEPKLAQPSMDGSKEGTGHKRKRRRKIAESLVVSQKL